VKAFNFNKKVDLGKLFLGKEHLFLNSFIAILSVTILLLTYSLIAKIIPHKEMAKPTSGTDSVHTLQVEVLNACGKAGIGDKCVDFLRKNKLDVVQTGNYPSFDVPHTIIINRSGNIERSKYIAQLLAVDTSFIIKQYNKNYYVDASVIIGKDYKVLPFLK